MFNGVMSVGFVAGLVRGFSPATFGYLANNHFTNAAPSSIIVSWYNGPPYQAIYTLSQHTANTETTIAAVKRA
jgi:hypothetical protein